MSGISIQVTTAGGLRSFPVTELPCSIGSCDLDGVRLRHSSIAPSHVVISRTANGDVVLTPQADNVSNAKGPIRGPIRLSDGTRLKIGVVRIEVRMTPSPGVLAKAQPAVPGLRHVVPAVDNGSKQAVGAGSSGVLVIFYGTILAVILAGASVPVYFLYGRLAEARAKELADQAVSVPASDAADPSGATNECAELIRKGDGMMAVMTEFCDSWKAAGAREYFFACLDLRNRAALADLIVARFKLRAGGDQATSTVQAVDDLDAKIERNNGGERLTLRIFADMLGVEPKRIRNEILENQDRHGLGAKNFEPGGLPDGLMWSVGDNDVYPEDRWCSARIGVEPAMVLLTAGAAKAHHAADAASAALEQRLARCATSAKALVALEEAILDAPKRELMPVEAFTFVQREYLREQAGKVESTTSEINNIVESNRFIPYPGEMWSYFERLAQIRSDRWQFRVPSLRAALDAHIAYVGGRPREWAQGFLRSVTEMQTADIDAIARLRWDYDGLGAHYAMYKDNENNIQATDLEGVTTETPAWLERTILGEILIDGRRNAGWRARVQREAPQEFKAIENWLGAVAPTGDAHSEFLTPSDFPPSATAR